MNKKKLMWTNEVNLADAVVGQRTFAATVKPISAQLRSDYRMIAGGRHSHGVQ
jgi:hypothetical protein